MIYVRIEEVRPGVYDMFLGDRCLGRRRTPLLSAARLLLAEGTDPAAIIAIGRTGKVDLHGTVGACASLIVIEDESSGPKFAKYRPRPSELGRSPPFGR
jgi:hypothetical protein